MNITLLVTGKTVKGFIEDGVKEYSARLSHYVNFSVEVIPDIKNAKNLTPVQLKNAEGDNIIKHTDNNGKIILLDEKGTEFKSTDFASFIQKQMNGGIKNMTFVIGGAYGLSDKIKETFKDKISMSKMTFSHQMIRLIFTEQLYRAFTILKNEPYHNE